MATLLRVPEVAAGATEVVLSEWLVEERALSPATPIAVVETEKAVVEVEAETDGVVLRDSLVAGTTVEVGSPMALLGAADELDRGPRRAPRGPRLRRDGRRRLRLPPIPDGPGAEAPAAAERRPRGATAAPEP